MFFGAWDSTYFCEKCEKDPSFVLWQCLLGFGACLQGASMYPYVGA